MSSRLGSSTLTRCAYASIAAIATQIITRMARSRPDAGIARGARRSAAREVVDGMGEGSEGPREVALGESERHPDVAGRLEEGAGDHAHAVRGHRVLGEPVAVEPRRQAQEPR